MNTHAICPECTSRKCRNCVGQALDERADEIVDCACSHKGGQA